MHFRVLPSFLPILKHMLKLKEAEAAIIDATLVESAARPRSRIQAPKTGPKAICPTIRRCISAPIRIHGWVKKRGEKYAGLQGITRTDEEGFVDTIYAIPANQTAGSVHMNTFLEPQKPNPLRGRFFLQDRCVFKTPVRSASRPASLSYGKQTISIIRTHIPAHRVPLFIEISII